MEGCGGGDVVVRDEVLEEMEELMVGQEVEMVVVVEEMD